MRWYSTSNYRLRMYCFSTLTMKKQSRYVHVMHTRPNTYKEMHMLEKKFTKSKLGLRSGVLHSDCSTPNPRENIFGRICRENLLKHLRGKRFRIRGRSFSRLYFIELKNGSAYLVRCGHRRGSIWSCKSHRKRSCRRRGHQAGGREEFAPHCYILADAIHARLNWLQIET